jgi:hypothetical protein
MIINTYIPSLRHDTAGSDGDDTESVVDDDDNVTSSIFTIP